MLADILHTALHPNDEHTYAECPACLYDGEQLRAELKKQRYDVTERDDWHFNMWGWMAISLTLITIGVALWGK